VCVRNLRAERFYCVRPIRIVAGVMNTTSPLLAKMEIEKKKVDPKNQMRSIIEGRNFDSSSLLPFPLSLSPEKTPDPTKRKRAVPECPRIRLHPPLFSTLSCDSTTDCCILKYTNKQTDRRYPTFGDRYNTRCVTAAETKHKIKRRRRRKRSGIVSCFFPVFFCMGSTS
jgi:hypothetical protein